MRSIKYIAISTFLALISFGLFNEAKPQLMGNIDDARIEEARKACRMALQRDLSKCRTKVGGDPEGDCLCKATAYKNAARCLGELNYGEFLSDTVACEIEYYKSLVFCYTNSCNEGPQVLRDCIIAAQALRNFCLLKIGEVIENKSDEGENNTIEDQDISIYPTVSKGGFTIKASDVLLENVNLAIYNLMGQKVFEKTFESGSSTYNISTNLSAGQYVYLISTGETNKRGKLIITM